MLTVPENMALVPTGSDRSRFQRLKNVQVKLVFGSLITTLVRILTFAPGPSLRSFTERTEPQTVTRSPTLSPDRSVRAPRRSYLRG